jgi:hypothetical protein
MLLAVPPVRFVVVDKIIDELAPPVPVPPAAPPATVVAPNVVVPPVLLAAPAEPKVYVTVPPGVTGSPIT